VAKPKDNSKATTVTRVKAKDDKQATPKTSKTAPTKALVLDGEQQEPKQNVFKRFIGYFKGAWVELRQVRWPNRRATWGMTAALLIFTGFFIVLILVTDTLWENLFKLIVE
jgi:preprotein translocase subunit SecE